MAKALIASRFQPGRSKGHGNAATCSPAASLVGTEYEPLFPLDQSRHGKRPGYVRVRRLRHADGRHGRGPYRPSLRRGRRPGRPQIRPALRAAGGHPGPICAAGTTWDGRLRQGSAIKPILQELKEARPAAYKDARSLSMTIPSAGAATRRCSITPATPGLSK